MIEGRILGRCWAFDRLASVGAHLWWKGVGGEGDERVGLEEMNYSAL